MNLQRPVPARGVGGSGNWRRCWWRQDGGRRMPGADA
jgi:hypothetical protein